MMVHGQVLMAYLYNVAMHTAIVNGTSTVITQQQCNNNNTYHVQQQYSNNTLKHIYSYSHSDNTVSTS